MFDAEKRQLKIDDWQRVPQSIEVEMLRHGIRAMVRLNLKEVACLVEEETFEYKHQEAGGSFMSLTRKRIF